jgi:hypothetical protein
MEWSGRGVFYDTILNFLYSETSQVPVRNKPLTLYRAYDNVLLGQGYHIPHGAVIDEYGVMVEWWLAGENLPHCHLVHNDSHFMSTRTEPGSAQWEASI